MNEPSKELLDDLLPGEKVYPIFHVKAKWSQDVTKKDGDMRERPAWQTEGLPEGRLWNGSGWDKMPKVKAVDGCISELTREVEEEWWPTYRGQHADLNFADLKVTVTFRRWEVWCIEWFQHWTWDVGLADQEVLQSFDRFVDRTERLNRDEGKMVDGSWVEPYCLMGAEDRYRWHGTKTGAPEERTDPPCRCPHCKEQGVVRIAH